MRNLSLIPYFDIQLFGEGAGGAGGGTGAGGDAGGSAANGQSAAALAQPQQGVKGNPLANVQYGKQDGAPAAGEQAGNISPDERAAKFEALIKGEYKDLYESRMQETIRRRLKGNEDIVNRYNKLSGTLDLLGSKYGLDPSDADFEEKLSQSIEDDESYFEDEALEKGLTVQQVKEIRKMQRENAQLKQQMEQQQTQQRADALLASWMQQEEQLKGIYPGFDLATELQNEQFRALLNSNVPLQTAFEVLHKDEIIPAAMQYTARQVTAKVANAVQAGQKRPAEGAMGSRSAVVTKSDVSQLTKADRQEIARRVARGERIVF